MKTVKQMLQLKGGAVHSVTPQTMVFDALKLMAEKTSARYWCWPMARSPAS